MLRLILGSILALVPVVIISGVTLADEASAAKSPTARLWPDGNRPKLTTSRVVGSPEPPLPYTTERVYPKLKLNFPVAVAHQPGSDRIWIITLDGPKGATVLRRFVDQPDASDTETLLPADDRVAYDICFHPDFLTNGFVYIGHNQPVKEGGEKYSRVSRFALNPKPPYEFDPKSERIIIEWPSDGHNGAAITFGLDRMMYVTSGDGTSDSDTNLRGQEMSLLTAKVLRLDVDHPVAGKMYSVPRDNPFVGKAGIAPETWAFGLRNPWRMTTDQKTGHIWVGNNGQDLWEQVYFIRKGDNYGWSVYEGSYPFYLNRELGPAPHVKPAFEHHHTEARSLTGGIVYYGKRFPDLVGQYLYGDHSTGRIWAGRHDGSRVVSHSELSDTPFHISGFGTTSQGEILICDYVGQEEGGLYTLVPTPPRQVTTPFPQKLSETGLFRSVQNHIVEPALIPYAVNAPLWSDGAEKTRYIAIPGDDPKIENTGNRGWNFPNETVLVKSFSLEMTAGDPRSKRWTETRLMTKQQNEWIGYSYRWNDEQTEAVLVGKAGMDVDYSIREAAGERRQTWHYPSRTECMVCHARAAGFVLGLSTAQMNRDCVLPVKDNDARKKNDRDDPSSTTAIAENQLDMLQRLGLLKLDKASDQQERLVDPYDSRAPLEARAKSYLHANCAICHVDAGGGNAQIQLEFSTPLDKMKLVDAIPLHDRFGLKDARLVAAGDPERSVLLHRMKTRGRGQMPQLATSRVDQAAVEMLAEWIRQLPREQNAGPAQGN